MLGDEKQTLAKIHYIRMCQLWGKRWADEHAFVRGRWPIDEKEWRQTPHGSSWDTNVEMARLHLRVASKMQEEGII